MRLLMILLPALLTAAAAEAQSISVNKGQWHVTQDVYYEASADGEPLDFPAEHSAVDECWMLDEEVMIDASMVEMFEGCSATDVNSREFGLDIGMICDFDGLEVDGAAQFSVSHGKDSFVAQIYLQSIARAPVDFQSHIVMIGHRTGTCQAPG